MELVISKPGTKVRMRDGRLILGRDKEVYISYPINHIQTIICLSGVYITEPVQSYITKNDGAILYVTKTGKLKYIVQPLRSILTVKTRMKQYALNENCSVRLKLSKILVYSNIQNGQRFLAEKLGAYSGRLNRIRALRNRVKYAKTITQLRGIEGNAAREYFRQFRELIPSRFGFFYRQKRMKLDIINSGLDFLYSLLYHTSFTALSSVGLDPYLGFYHSTAYGHAALSSDIMEPFRAQIADRVMLKTLKDGAFKQFYDKNSSSAILTGDMIRLLMKYYTKRIHARQLVNGGGKSNFELIIRDASNLSKYCREPGEGYRPWVRG